MIQFKMYLKSTIIFILTLTFINAESDCPKPCTCNQGSMDCSSKQLAHHLNDTVLEGLVFNNISYDNNLIIHLKPFPVMTVKKLSFRNNGISKIDVATFRQVKNLTVIDLSNNHLTSHALIPHIFMGTYSPEAYEPLKNLKALYLSGNSLHTLHPDVFEHLPNLQILKIDSNPLKMIDKTTSIAIASLMHLKELDLSSTEISKLPPTMLHTPRFLETLNLGNNQFTSIPSSLGEADESLETVIFDNNPIVELQSFPVMNNLKVLSLNYMPKLIRIKSGAFKKLQNLKELSIAYNPHLEYIAEDALTENLLDNERTWPALDKLYLNHNKLPYLGLTFLARWDNLKELDVSMNPWVCDCENQWFLSTLVPQFIKVNKNKANYMMCEEPIEMRGRFFVNLSREAVHMRCLDIRGSRPEKDAVVLIAILFGLLLAVPLSMGVIVIYQKTYGSLSPMVRFSYQRASFVESIS